MTDNTSTPAISILLPTRGRTDMLDRSVTSLFENADDPENVEWLFGFDNDDTESFEYFAQNIAQKIADTGGKISCYRFQPMGYERLHHYVNTLAGRSKGDWMVFWNDDAVMKSPGWDTVIRSHTGKFVLQAFDTHNKHPYSIFPIVPRQWLEIIGHLSNHQLNDAWLSQIAWMLDIMERIDVQVEHDRADLTGNNKDATFENRLIFEGRPEDPRDFNYISRRRARMAEAEKIAMWLKENNHDTTFWENVKAGRQDPWQKMLEADVNGQMKRFD